MVIMVKNQLIGIKHSDEVVYERGIPRAGRWQEQEFFRRIQSPKVTEVIVLRRDDAIMQGGRLLQAIQAYKKP